MSEIRVPQGTQCDIWSGVNVSGTLTILIRTKSGANSITLWWVTWGLGTVTQLGTLRDAQHLLIPISWWKGVVSAHLRASATEDTVVYLSERAEIDYSKTFTW